MNYTCKITLFLCIVNSCPLLQGMGVGFKNETILHSLKEVKCLQGCSRTLLLAIYFSKVDKHCTCHRHGGCHCALGFRVQILRMCKCYFSILLLLNSDWTSQRVSMQIYCLIMGSFFQIIIFVNRLPITHSLILTLPVYTFFLLQCPHKGQGIHIPPLLLSQLSDMA